MEKLNEEYEPHHPRLFEEIRHLKPDYFISGDPNIPDHTEECWDEYVYWNEMDILRGYFDGKES